MTIMISLFAIPSIRPAHAINAPSVSDPANLWYPYAPGTSPTLRHVNIVEYGKDTAAIADFETGALDVLDTGQSGQGIPPAKWSAYEANPDWFITPLQGSSVWQGIYFDFAGSAGASQAQVWSVWGCDMQHGNSPCGIEIRQAFAHLVDRQRFIVDGPLGGAAVAIADDVPSSVVDSRNGVAIATPVASQCTWDTLFAVYNAKFGPCISAFHWSTSPGGFASPPTANQVGANDFCMAVDHIMNANIGLNRDNGAFLDAFGNHCGIDSNSPGIVNNMRPSTGTDNVHHLDFKVRLAEPRHTLGDKLTVAINQLFGLSGGLTVVDEHVKQSWASVVFRCCSASHPTGRWGIYTFGYQINTPAYPGLFPTYDSLGASNLCGPSVVPGTHVGTLTTSPGNPSFVCIPSLDAALEASASTNDLATFYTDNQNAMNIMGATAQDLPLYTLGLRVASLRAAAAGTNVDGVAYEHNYYFQYVHKGSYVPVNPNFQFNHGGNPDTIRWGATGGGIVGTLGLNIFNFGWVWEADIINMVYSTLMTQDPVSPANVFCDLCDSVSQSVDAAGNTHFLVELRPNIHWQDGVPLDASDVKFSLLTSRDQLGNNPLLLDVHIISSTLVDIIMQGQSVLHLLNLGTVNQSSYIIPRHIWECPASGVSAITGFGACNHTLYGDVGDVDPGKLDSSYDPVALGTFIGSGAWECISPAGHIGGPCTTSGTQVLAPGDSAFLTTYDNTNYPGNLPGTSAAPTAQDQWFRNFNTAWPTGNEVTSHSGAFQEFRWADNFNIATVDVQDLAAVGACVGLTSCVGFSHWHQPTFHPASQDATAKSEVNVEFTLVNNHLDDTWVSPYAWPSAVAGTRLPNITPFT